MKHSFDVSLEQAGMRIDLFLGTQFPTFSRTLLKKLITNEQVIINNSITAKPSYSIKYQDTITLLSIPIPTERLQKKVDSDLGITIIAQHDDFIIINKPAGLVVHPPQQTYTDVALTDWLIEKFPEIAAVGAQHRPGIVHRLDRNTSGIMIIALTEQAYQAFTAMFKARTIQKTYQALVMGHPHASGTITYDIGRHPVQKNMMHCSTALQEQTTARDAQTDYKVLQYFQHYSLLELTPKTGRTHQIRVHCKAIGHPLLGDTVYGTASKLLKYHALHAHRLQFTYNGVSYAFTSELDLGLQEIINVSTPI